MHLPANFTRIILGFIIVLPSISPLLQIELNKTGLELGIDLPIEPAFDAERDVIYRLFTKSNPIIGDIIVFNNISSLQNSHFNGSKDIKFYTHGWNFNPGPENCLAGFDQSTDVNLICVDWGVGAVALYPIAVNYAIEVGKFTGKYIDWLIDQGPTADQFQLIAHSLGSHISGIAGRSVTRGQVSSLIALDPPFLQWGENSQRIRPGDAKYVEVVHTTNTLGYIEPIGDADFYPNGGSSMPGCGLVDTDCSHNLAIDYFFYSIDNTCFMGDKCETLDDMFNERCSNLTRFHMGGFTPKLGRGIYRFKTTANPVYCLG